MGIIPALAGNTQESEVDGLCLRDHPRSRGEYFTYPRKASIPAGSSPLSRGILAQDALLGVKIGIIPALAGNTFSCCQTFQLVRDHPRSRGEYLVRCLHTGSDNGSSPLSRGILSLRRETCQRIRIIPALAGNTEVLQAHLTWSWDHPRSRGEYFMVPPSLVISLGSSPLSRGIRGGVPGPEPGLRIIPALAGNTSRIPESCYGLADHPRSRGEYFPVSTTETR